MEQLERIIAIQTLNRGPKSNGFNSNQIHAEAKHGGGIIPEAVQKSTVFEDSAAEIANIPSMGAVCVPSF